MEFIAGLVIGLAIGFIAGFLVYRNNANNLKAREAALKDELAKVKGDISGVKDSGKRPFFVDKK